MLCLVFTICSKEYVECVSPRGSSEQFYFLSMGKINGTGCQYYTPVSRCEEPWAENILPFLSVNIIRRLKLSLTF